MLLSYNFVFCSLSSTFFGVVLGSSGYIISLQQGPLASSFQAKHDDLVWRGRAFSVPPLFNVLQCSHFAGLVGALLGLATSSWLS